MATRTAELLKHADALLRKLGERTAWVAEQEVVAVPNVLKGTARRLTKVIDGIVCTLPVSSYEASHEADEEKVDDFAAETVAEHEENDKEAVRPRKKRRNTRRRSVSTHRSSDV